MRILFYSIVKMFEVYYVKIFLLFILSCLFHGDVKAQIIGPDTICFNQEYEFLIENLELGASSYHFTCNNLFLFDVDYNDMCYY